MTKQNKNLEIADGEEEVYLTNFWLANLFFKVCFHNWYGWYFYIIKNSLQDSSSFAIGNISSKTARNCISTVFSMVYPLRLEFSWFFFLFWCSSILAHIMKIASVNWTCWWKGCRVLPPTSKLRKGLGRKSGQCFIYCSIETSLPLLIWG